MVLSGVDELMYKFFKSYFDQSIQMVRHAPPVGDSKEVFTERIWKQSKGRVSLDIP